MLFSHLSLDFPSIDLPVKILKPLLTSLIVATHSAYLNLLELIALVILHESY